MKIKMKYKLTNKQTNEETLCDKVTIDGFDYYVSDEKIKIGDKGWLYEDGYIKSLCEFDCTKELNGITITDKKVIATDNPNIDIPKVVNEVEILVNKLDTPENLDQFSFDKGFIDGYNKSQETHSFSEEDMIEFQKWCQKEKYSFDAINNDYVYVGVKKHEILTQKELLQLWKEQQPKIVYYE